MELAGKYIKQRAAVPIGLGPGQTMSNEQLAIALDALVNKGYTFEDAMVQLMAGVDLRNLRKE
jgi:hypothetical protein